MIPNERLMKQRKQPGFPGRADIMLQNGGAMIKPTERVSNGAGERAQGIARRAISTMQRL